MPGGRLSEQQIHPAERLELPGGGEADIDLPMVPVVCALWGMGFTTLGCCQNLGESIARNGHGSPVAAKDRQRWVDFYQGFAWLKLPTSDANRLVGVLGADPVFGHRMRRWTHPDAWQSVIWLSPAAENGHAGPEPMAQITFPESQLDDLGNRLAGYAEESGSRA